MIRLRRAFSLAEAVVSIGIVSVMLVAALNTVAAAKLGAQKTGDRAKGTLLAQQLMAEVLGQSYEEQVDTIAFGREASELSTGRANYDDVDDYNGWSASPPQYKDGTVIPNLDGWGRRVSVVRGNPANLTQEAGTDTGVKRITVSVTHNGLDVEAPFHHVRDGLDVASLTAIRTLARDNMEK